MKRILLLMCTLPLMFCSCEDTDDEVVSGGKTKMDYSAIAKEVFDIIEKNYRITDGTHKGLMQENAPKNPMTLLVLSFGRTTGICRL